MDFNVLKNYFIKEDLPGAIDYMSQFPEMSETTEAYKDLFCCEHYIHYDIPDVLTEILLIYQKYFRDVFYLKIQEETASSSLLQCLKQKLGSDDLEKALKSLFEANGYHILTGKTEGHYGPYVWKTTKVTTYNVELPNGVSKYTVNLLSDFVMASWMDYLTFGQYGTSGWIGKDGTINCIESRYNLESEKFLISLLNHEAQHTVDIKRWPDMPQEKLEYRAKLVELMYSSSSNLLKKFISEADENNRTSAHVIANTRIKKEMSSFTEKTISEIQFQAKMLFLESSK